jgi:hypothetical protein
MTISATARPRCLSPSTCSKARSSAAGTARARGRVHRKGKARAVRVRLQGVGGDPSHQAQRWSVCAACPRHARQPLRWPHIGAGWITELEALTGVETRRIHVDKGYRGHTHAQKFRVWISGQVRRVSTPIRREMRRRAASDRSKAMTPTQGR